MVWVMVTRSAGSARLTGSSAATLPKKYGERRSAPAARSPGAHAVHGASVGGAHAMQWEGVDAMQWEGVHATQRGGVDAMQWEGVLQCGGVACVVRARSRRTATNSPSCNVRTCSMHSAAIVGDKRALKAEGVSGGGARLSSRCSRRQSCTAPAAGK
jgi:hypothetical protein